MCESCRKLQLEVSLLNTALAETERQWRERGVRILELETLIAAIDCHLGEMG
jgi:hypothetical protein